MNKPRNVGCKVAGCPNPHRSLGYCSVHYQRFHRLGVTTLPSQGITRISDMRKPGRKPAKPSAAVIGAGTITFEEWKRQNNRGGDIHHVRRQPDTGTNGLGGRGRGGDAA